MGPVTIGFILRVSNAVYPPEENPSRSRVLICCSFLAATERCLDLGVMVSSINFCSRGLVLAHASLLRFFIYSVSSRSSWSNVFIICLSMANSSSRSFILLDLTLFLREMKSPRNKKRVRMRQDETWRKAYRKKT